MVATRGFGAARSSGRSRTVRANGPRKLLPNCSSKPSTVVMRVGGAIIPALLINTSIGVPSGEATGELFHGREVSQIDVADVEVSGGLAREDLVPGLLALCDGADPHHDTCSRSRESPGGLLARAAVGARDDDELAGLVGDLIHGGLLHARTDRRSVTCKIADRWSDDKGPL